MNLYGNIVKYITTSHGDTLSATVEEIPYAGFKVESVLWKDSLYYRTGSTKHVDLLSCIAELDRLEKLYQQPPIMYTNYLNLQALYDLNLGLHIIGKGDDYYGTRDFHHFYTTLSYEDAIQTFDKYVFIRSI